MKNEINYIYPATSLQQGFIFHSLNQPTDDAYRVQELLDYHQHLDLEMYVKAWEYCIAQYPALRTAFNWEEDIIQLIYKYGKLDYQVHDITHLVNQADRDAVIESIQREDRKKGFDLSRPTLFRLHIIKQAEHFYTVLKTQHHSILDGWSGPVLFASVQRYYQQLKDHKPVTVDNDIAYLETQEYVAKHKNHVHDYWQKVLSEVDSSNDIRALLTSPIDLSTYKKVEQTGKNTLRITGELYKELKALTLKEGITINVIVQFVWNKLLQVYSSSSKTIVGTTVSGRDLPIRGIEDSVGLYINTLPLILDWDNDNSIIAQLHQIQQKISELNSNSFADLTKLQKGAERIFHSLIIFENYPISEENNTEGLVSVRDYIEKVDYPLYIMSYEYHNGLAIELNYDGNYLTEDKANHHLDTLKIIIQDLIKEPHKPHHQIVLLQPEAYKQVIYDWNSTDRTYAKEKVISVLFEEQAAKNPDAIALVYEGKALSYQELNEKSNQLTKHIQFQYEVKTKKSISNDTLIALCLDRSLEMVIGMLAILKTGGAYIPLDPNYPQERVDFIVEDTKAALILTKKQFIETSNIQLPEDKLIQIDLEADLYKSGNTQNFVQHATATHLAYVIYTSGTTGKPKGVMIDHGGLSNFLSGMNHSIPLKMDDHLLAITSISFDISILELLWTLTNGATVTIKADHVLNNFNQFLMTGKDRSPVTAMQITPSYLAALLEDESSLDFIKSLKSIIVGGERFSKELLVKLQSLTTSDIYNMYGPTETTIWSTFQKAKPHEALTLGKPIQNTKIYILDPKLTPVPIGVSGELYIGGAGLARAYLNRPELTAERFISNPFSTHEDKRNGYHRLYKTGDLVRWLPDGNLEFIGRNDEQVKIRGYRIELKEIEHALLQMEEIKQVCVLAREKKTEHKASSYLVGYYVLNHPTEAIDHASLTLKLKKVLPEYMIPSTFVAMEAFPLMVNGKLNKRELPDPETNESEYVAPVSETEKILCTIWQQLLGQNKISINDDFFRLGGDSILSIQLVSRIRQAEFNCQVKDIFEYRTIYKLAEHLTKKKPELIIQSEQGLLSGALDFLPVQKWFMNQADNKKFAAPAHYNQSFLIKVPELDTKKLERVIYDLVAYHDILRVRFRKDNSKKWQQCYESKPDLIELKKLDISKYTQTEVQKVLTEWQSQFNLEKGPLFQAGYLYGYEDGSARIYIALHHLITDTVSWRIIGEDIKMLYDGMPLPEKGSSYRQWAACIKTYADQHSDELAYWENQLKHILNRDAEHKEEYHIEFIELTNELTALLLQEAPKAYQTEVNDLLLTALAYALKEINQEAVQYITLEGHGREFIDPTIDHSHTVGWFTSMFPVKLEVKHTLGETIQSVKEYLRHIPNKGIGFGALAERGNYTHADLPSICFNYLGQMNHEHGDWQIIPEESGYTIHTSNSDSNLININGSTIHGELKFNIVTKLGESLTKQLSETFKETLVHIIKHTVEKLEKQGVSYTPSDFRSVQISQEVLNQLAQTAKASQNEIQHIYPANSLQQGFIYHVLNQAEDDAYRVQELIDYHESLDIDSFIKAWELCMIQYPTLRMAFNWDHDLIQIIYKHGKLDYQVHDLSHLGTQEERDESIRTIQQLDRSKGFDLSQPTLFRLHIIKQANNYYTLIKTEHLSILDGWSGPLLLSSLHSYYKQIKNHKVPFIKEQTTYLQSQEYISKHKGEAHDYWAKHLAEVDTANDISAILSQPVDLNNYTQVENPDANELEITDEFYAQLKAFIQDEGITFNILIQFAWHKLIHVYSSSPTSIVGTTVSGRDLPIDGIEKSVGLHINTLPLIINWNNSSNIREQLQHIQKKSTELSTFSFADLVKLQKDGERIFHSMFIYENFPESEGNKDDGFNTSPRDYIDKVDYPLCMYVYEYHNRLVVQLTYDKDYLTEEKAQHHLLTLKRIILQVIKDASQPQHKISLLQPVEYKQLIKWNTTEVAYPTDKTFIRLFEEQVLKRGSGTAIVCEGKRLSYQELNEKSNQLAHHLRSSYQFRKGKPLPPDTLITICMERSLEIVVGILGVLKAGGAYVPLDPSYPQDRIDYVLEDTNSAFILIRKDQVKSRVNLPTEKVLSIDLSEELYNTNSKDNLNLSITPQDLAYIIYTSGSTGKPKGAMIEHAGMLNHLYAKVNLLHLDEKSIVAQNASQSFDISVWQFLAGLLTGGQVMIYAGDLILNPSSFLERLSEDKTDILEVVPSYLSAMLNELEKQNKPYLTDIAYLLVTGEELKSDLVKRWFSLYPGKSLVNAYGPTEASDDITHHVMTSYDGSKYIPVGKPVQNLKLYIVDPSMQLCPIGVSGEICVSGIGVGRGYLNNPSKTKEVFMDDPFSSDKGLRLYKTGDIGKWLPDGSIQYSGRKDEQVKIRGYRIELGEIEHALTQLDGIKQACVLVKERSNEGGAAKYLVGYYVGDTSQTSLTIQNQLSEVLPEFMVPSVLVSMEKFPLTANGKLDKKGLPDPDFTSSVMHVAPRTELESLLCNIWQEVLNIERISVTDNFFRIGGDSILSIQVSSRIRQAGYVCHVKDIFECKTIAKLAYHLNHETSGILIKSEQGVLSGELDLLPIQHFFVSQVHQNLFRNPNHYNQSFLIRVPDMDTERLSAIIEELVSYHDVLRIRYSNENGHWKQFYEPRIIIPALKQLDVSVHSSLEIAEILTEWQSNFNLEKGELFQVGYLYGYDDGSARIYFALHHMIIDGVSWRILTDDIKQLYLGKSLPAKGSSYRQWVESVKNYRITNAFENPFWLAQLKEMPSYSELNCAENCVIVIDLDKSLTKNLLYEASKAYHTEVNDLLLTALAYALKGLNDSSIQGITLEGHGRESIDPGIDHSHTLGWFTCMFPVKLELKDTLRETIQSIKEHLRSIPNKGFGFGSFSTAPDSAYSFDKLAPVSFNYLGQFDTQEGDWQVVSENSGNSVHKSNEDRNLINMNGMVNKGKLEFTIASKMGFTATQQFGEHFREELTRIINHCVDRASAKETSHTPSDFGFVRISQKLLDDIEQTAKKNNNEVLQLYAANSLQQGFIYHALSQPADDAYRVQILYDYYESLDLSNYLKAWEYCTAKYPILRTAFNWQEELIQVIYKHAKLHHHFHDISHLTSQEERDQAIIAIQKEDLKVDFNLSEPGLFRLHIIKQAKELYTVLKTEHHSIADGWSGPVLFNSVHDSYQHLKSNKIPALKEDTAYLLTQEYIAKNKGSVNSYWHQELNEAEGPNDITALLSKAIDTETYTKVEELANTSIEIGDDLYRQLKHFVTKEGITTNALLQFTWHKLLQVYSHSLKTIVGTTVSGRDLPIEDIENSVGLYINTLPLIINWDTDNSAIEYLHQIQQKITDLNTHSFVDLAKLQKDGERLFHSLLVFENFPEPQGEQERLDYEFRDFTQKVNYPLCIQANENSEGLMITLQHDTYYLTKDKARHHLETVKRIMSQVIQQPLQSHRTISLLQTAEYEEIVQGWNFIDTSYGKDKTICTLFGEQVSKTPDAIALVCEGKKLSYHELNEKSNQLARYIQSEYTSRTKKSITGDTFIALYLERSVEMVLGILAVLKAGGAYVPLDTGYPQERIDYILEDTKAGLILTQKQLIASNGSAFPEEKLRYIDLTESLYKKEDPSDFISPCKATDLAYVIYTSGTTGKPKGVMVEHHQVVSFASSNNFIEYDNVTVVAGVSNYAFDGSIFDLFFSLGNGKTLLLIDNKSLLDLSRLDEQFTKYQADTVFITTALFNSLVQHQFKCLNNLRQLLFGGERCNIELINKFKALYPNTSLVHVYGPTENIVYSTYCKLNDYDTTSVAPIGRRLSEKKLYVLGANKTVVPVGVVGELYIGGPGVARGYLNNAALTHERFVPNPFATATDKERGDDRLYKTGDLVRWLADGNLEFMGRNDDQVKIRGFRIELGEIEYALMQIEGIQQAAVLVKERKTEAGISKYLAAYYVVNPAHGSIDQNSIFEKLSQSLPEYMVPAALVVMEAFPLTANGKLNKKQLPDPDFNASEKEYISPENELETLLCNIWKEILNLENISTADNFFRIGGDSILSIQVSSRVRQAGYACQVKDMFECKTISKLAERLNRKKTNISYRKEEGNLTGPLEFLPIQDWFLEKADTHCFPKMNHYNQSFLIKVPPLDVERLKRVIPDLVSYHDVMRIRVTKEKQGNGTGTWHQTYMADVDLPALKTLNVSEYTPAEVKKILTDWQSHYNLESGPIFQIGYLEGYSDGSARIFFSLHHLMIDGVSWRILTEDLKALYSGKSLPEKGSSYRQWTDTVKAYADKNPSEAAYWATQLKDIPAYKSEHSEEPFHEEYFELSVEHTKSLLQEVSKAYHTEVNDLLLTAFAYGLKEINQHTIQGITLEGHGREDIDPEIDHNRTVGWFTTMFPVKLEIKNSIRESIQAIKENLRSIPNKGIGYGSFVKSKTTDYNYNDLPLICFNYLGQFDTPDDNWQVGSEVSGAYINPENKELNQISVNGMVDNGRLWFNIKTKLGVAPSKKLCEGFHAHLINVIEHCKDKLEHKESVHTPSDFKKVQISQSLLDKLQQKIKNS